MTKNIVLITGNEGKRKEVESILGNDKFTVINMKLDLPELQSTNVTEVITEKIKSALTLAKEHFNEIKEKFKERGQTISTINDVIIICEDTGLHIKDMNNFPGALIKFYYESVGNQGIINRDANSKAEINCVVGIVKNGKIGKPIVGKVKGKISSKLLGETGFGWDPVFIPDLSKSKYKNYNGKTYAELEANIKDKISHRYIAFNKLREKLL
jgi:non-canonical purine NTP pyrophosphatase (RdgB/HAM1 family)